MARMVEVKTGLGKGEAYVEIGPLEMNIRGHALSGREADVSTIQVADELEEHHDGCDVEIQLADQGLLPGTAFGILDDAALGWGILVEVGADFLCRDFGRHVAVVEMCLA